MALSLEVITNVALYELFIWVWKSSQILNDIVNIVMNRILCLSRVQLNEHFAAVNSK